MFFLHVLIILLPLASSSPFCFDFGNLLATLSTRSWETMKQDFLRACHSGQTVQLERILNELQRIPHGRESSHFSLDDFRDYQGNTGLIIAAAKDHSNVVALLASVPHNRRADKRALSLNVNSKNNFGTTALTIAIRKNRFKSFMALLRSPQLDVNMITWNGSTPLILAILAGQSHRHIIQILLQNTKGLDVNKRDSEGLTALMVAAKTGSVVATNLLLSLSKEINVNTVNLDGLTALSIALIEDHERVALRILQDPRITLKNPEHNIDIANDLQIACIKGQAKAVSSILKIIQLKNSDKEQRDIINYGYAPQCGMTALHFAIQNKQHEIVSRLLASAPSILDVNKPDFNGTTPLMLAAEEGLTSIVEMLIKMGLLLDVNAKNHFGMSAFMIALDAFHFDIVELLLDHCPDIDVSTSDFDGFTPLMFSAKHGLEHTARLLLGNPSGKDIIFARDNDGWSPLMHAFVNNQTDMVQILLNYMNDNVSEKKSEIFQDLVVTLSHHNDHEDLATLILLHEIWFRLECSAVVDDENLKIELVRLLKDASTSKEDYDACGICIQSHEQDHVVTQCRHIFGRQCLLHWLKRNRSCPMCRTLLLPTRIFSLSSSGLVAGLDAR